MSDSVIGDLEAINSAPPEIYVELEALDGRTSQPMVRVVRKGHGLELENDSEQLSLATLRPALDVWARDAHAFQPEAASRAGRGPRGKLR